MYSNDSNMMKVRIMWNLHSVAFKVLPVMLSLSRRNFHWVIPVPRSCQLCELLQSIQIHHLLVIRCFFHHCKLYNIPTKSFSQSETRFDAFVAGPMVKGCRPRRCSPRPAVMMEIDGGYLVIDWIITK